MLQSSKQGGEIFYFEIKLVHPFAHKLSCPPVCKLLNVYSHLVWRELPEVRQRARGSAFGGLFTFPELSLSECPEKLQVDVNSKKF